MVTLARAYASDAMTWGSSKIPHMLRCGYRRKGPAPTARLSTNGVSLEITDIQIKSSLAPELDVSCTLVFLESTQQEFHVFVVRGLLQLE